MKSAHSSETSEYTQHTKRCNITEDHLSDTHKENLKIYKNQRFKKVPEHHTMKACRGFRVNMYILLTSAEIMRKDISCLSGLFKRGGKECNTHRMTCRAPRLAVVANENFCHRRPLEKPCRPILNHT